MNQIKLSSKAVESINRWGHFPGHTHSVIQREIQNENLYDEYERHELIDVINYVKNQNLIYQDEVKDYKHKNNEQWHDIKYYSDEWWKEKMSHAETEVELLEAREKIKELENKLYLKYKLLKSFWFYVLKKWEYLTFVLENVTG